MIYKVIINKTVFVEADTESEAQELAFDASCTFNETEETVGVYMEEI